MCGQSAAKRSSAGLGGRRSVLLNTGWPSLALALLSPQAATDGYGGGFQGHLQHMKWEFAVINSPQVKAYQHTTQLVLFRVAALSGMLGADERSNARTVCVCHRMQSTWE